MKYCLCNVVQYYKAVPFETDNAKLFPQKYVQDGQTNSNFFFFESLPFASTCTFLTSRAANTIIKKREATASFPYNLLSMRLAKGKLHIYCTRIALINLGQIVVEHEKTH